MDFLQLDPFSHSSGDTAAHFYQSHVIAIGTSAGGLNAVGVILSALPASFPAPILVVQHLSAEFPSRLASLLSGLTDLRVKEAEEGDSLQPGHVYVSPPGKHLLVGANHSLSLSSSAKVHHCRPSVDVLFRSVAASFGQRAIAVVLTGGDGDGATGIQAIKAAGGITLAQDQASSQQPSMPRHAAATGDVDFVVPLPDIAMALIALVSPSRAPVPTALSVPTALGDLVLNALSDADAKLEECSEALQVAQEALRVQDQASTSDRSPRRRARPKEEMSAAPNEEISCEEVSCIDNQAEGHQKS